MTTAPTESGRDDNLSGDLAAAPDRKTDPTGHHQWRVDPLMAAITAGTAVDLAGEDGPTDPENSDTWPPERHVPAAAIRRACSGPTVVRR